MIEKCFKCDGKGEVIVPDTSSPSFFKDLMKIGFIMKLKSDQCPRCLGSGAVDYRIVETKIIQIIKENT